MAAPAPKPRRLRSEAERSAILDKTLMQMAAGGMVRIETRSPTWAVLVTGQRVNTVAHLLATVFLCGLWLPVWIIAESTGGERRKTISVDDRGRVRDSSQRAQGQGATSVADPAQAKIFLVIGGIALLLMVIIGLWH
jgi:hypothetical protein